jgi:hypothetical protein
MDLPSHAQAVFITSSAVTVFAAGVLVGAFVMVFGSSSEKIPP